MPGWAKPAKNVDLNEPSRRGMVRLPCETIRNAPVRGRRHGLHAGRSVGHTAKKRGGRPPAWRSAAELQMHRAKCSAAGQCPARQTCARGRSARVLPPLRKTPSLVPALWAIPWAHTAYPLKPRSHKPTRARPRVSPPMPAVARRWRSTCTPALGKTTRLWCVVRPVCRRNVAHSPGARAEGPVRAPCLVPCITAQERLTGRACCQVLPASTRVGLALDCAGTGPAQCWPPPNGQPTRPRRPPTCVGQFSWSRDADTIGLREPYGAGAAKQNSR